MTEPARAVIETYYDERVEGKLRDFTQFNPRIEAAVQTLAEWAPAYPRRVLEVGCGIGATSWRMARAWPHAEVVGIDISPTSIDAARTCFERPNLSFCHGFIEEGVVTGEFDLILLMDVYEHITPTDRANFHRAIRDLLSDHSRVVMTFPTVHMQRYLKTNIPSSIQPVDEEIGLDEIRAFSRETNTILAFYRLVGIWRYADYAHTVFGRFNYLCDVAAREFIPEGFAGLRRRLKILVGHAQHRRRRHYLGYDVYSSSPRKINRLFDVSAQERKRRAASWTCQS